MTSQRHLTSRISERFAWEEKLSETLLELAVSFSWKFYIVQIPGEYEILC